MVRPFLKRSILLHVLLIALPVAAVVLVGLSAHSLYQKQVATSHLMALATDSTSAFDPHKGPVVTPQTVQRLLDQGADVNGGTNDWGTPLFRFAQAGNMNVVKLLLAHGADIRERVHWGYRGWFVKYEVTYSYTDQITVFCVSRADIMKMLLDKGADPNATDDLGRSVLANAVEGGDTDTTRLLRAQGAKFNAGDFAPRM